MAPRPSRLRGPGLAFEAGLPEGPRCASGARRLGWSVAATGAQSARAKLLPEAFLFSEAETDAAVDRVLRGQARGGEDDGGDHAEIEDVGALLEACAEIGPYAALPLGGAGAEIAIGVGGAAVDPGVAGDGDLEDDVLPALAEQASRREPELQAREAAAQAGFKLQLALGQPAQRAADVAVERERVPALGAHHVLGRTAAAAALREVDLVGERRRRGEAQEGDSPHARRLCFRLCGCHEPR